MLGPSTNEDGYGLEGLIRILGVEAAVSKDASFKEIKEMDGYVKSRTSVVTMDLLREFCSKVRCISMKLTSLFIGMVEEDDSVDAVLFARNLLHRLAIGIISFACHLSTQINSNEF